jgi:hypothetical protein
MNRPFAGLVTTATVLAFLLGVSPSSGAEGYMDNWRGQRVIQAQQLLFNDQFDQVDSIYREHIEDHPEDPTGYLFRAGALFAEMSDREDNLHEELFRRSLDTVDILTERILDACNDPTAAWMYLLRGHARAYQSLYQSKFGSFMSALKLGLATIDEYETGLKHDSTLYDLYAGIGSYHYWKSAKAGFLKWLGIFKDEKDKGIRELHLAADSSLLHRELAQSALIWVWLDRQEYDSAIAIARDFADRYPDGKTFLWPLAQALFAKGDYEQAAEVYAEIRTRLAPDPGNYFNLIECDYHLTQCYNWLGDKEHTRSAARQLNGYESLVSRGILMRQLSKVKFLRRMARR